MQQNSILKHLPAINERHLLILDSIRFTIEIIEYSFNKLENSLLSFSKSKTKQDYISISMFMYSWTILDTTRRLIKLYKTLPSNHNHVNVNIIEYVNSFRNTYQHLDERIDETLINSKKPFYGYLKWAYSNSESKKVENYMAISGLYYSENSEFIVGKYNEDKIIDEIILETVNKIEKTEVNLSKLFNEIKSVVESLENELEIQTKENKLQQYDWKHMRDIIFHFQNGES